MKEIVNGRKYDTATARMICRWTYDGWADDESALYVKKTGEYFVENWHNLMGAHIVPQTEADARRVAERHMDADAYEAEFGPVGE